MPLENWCLLASATLIAGPTAWIGGGLCIDNSQSAQWEQVGVLRQYVLELLVELHLALSSRFRDSQKQPPFLRFTEVNPQRSPEWESPLAQYLQQALPRNQHFFEQESFHQ